VRPQCRFVSKGLWVLINCLVSLIENVPCQVKDAMQPSASAPVLETACITVLPPMVPTDEEAEWTFVFKNETIATLRGSSLVSQVRAYLPSGVEYAIEFVEPDRLAHKKTPTSSFMTSG
jgi:hypothetical protein